MTVADDGDGAGLAALGAAAVEEPPLQNLYEPINGLGVIEHTTTTSRATGCDELLYLAICRVDANWRCLIIACDGAGNDRSLIVNKMHSSALGVLRECQKSQIVRICSICVWI